MARALELAVAAWAPLARGILSNKYASSPAAESQFRVAADDPRLNRRNLEIAAAVGEIAAELGVPPVQVALAWLRAQRAPVIPILGARTAEQLEQSLGAAHLELPASQRARLDELSEVTLGYPHDFLASVHSRSGHAGMDVR